MLQNKLKRLENKKVPRRFDIKNYIGIELEFLSKLREDEIRLILIDLGLQNIANLGDDSSIDMEEEDDFTYECRFMIEESKLEQTLLKMQTFVGAVDMRYNASCGLHVHLDMRNRDKTKCYNKLMNKWELIKRMTAPHRVNGYYCRFPDDEHYEYEYENAGYDSPEEYYFSDKYTAINRRNFYTIEIRSHEMTDDMAQLGNWIKFLLGIIDSKQSSRSYIANRIKQVAAGGLGDNYYR